MSLPPPPSDVIIIGADEYGCDMASDSRARFQPLTARTVVAYMKKKGLKSGQRAERTQPAVGYNYSISPTYSDSGHVVRRMSSDELQQFLAPKISAAQAHVPGEQQTEQKEDMSKQKSAPKKEGKIAFVVNLLHAGGKTKSQVAAALVKHFPGTAEKTAKNTVSWCASCYMPTHHIKSNHVDEPRAATVPKAKKSKTKAPPPKRAAKSKAKSPPARKAAMAKGPPPPKAAAPAEVPAEPAPEVPAEFPA